MQGQFKVSSTDRPHQGHPLEEDVGNGFARPAEDHLWLEGLALVPLYVNLQDDHFALYGVQNVPQADRLERRLDKSF